MDNAQHSLVTPNIIANVHHAWLYEYAFRAIQKEIEIMF
jgi:hypothetical protein